MTPRPPSPWSDEGNLDTLRRMWAEGKFAKEISANIPGSTRNSVIGQAHRMGLNPHPAACRPTKEAKAAAAREREQNRPPRVRKKRKIGGMPRPPFNPDPRPVRVAEGVEPSLNLSLLDMTVDQCRWRDDDGRGFDGFCGHKTKLGSSFCPAHHSIVYAPPIRRDGTAPRPFMRKSYGRSMGRR